MKEYIERELLKNMLQRDINECYEKDMTSDYMKGYHNGLTMAYAMTIGMHAADVVERVRGEWLDRRKEDCYTDEEPYVVKMEDGCPEMGCYCSICGDWLTASDEYSVRGNYCPNCGADMSKEEA